MFEDFETALSEGRKRRRYCKFSLWTQTLDGADSDRAHELLANLDYNCRELARYFNTKGAGVSSQNLNRHRNGACCGQVR